MISMSEKQFPQGKVGDSVKIRVPDVDRARGDSKIFLLLY